MGSYWIKRLEPLEYPGHQLLDEGKKSTSTAEQEGNLCTDALLSLCQRPKPGRCCSLPTVTQAVASSTLCLLGRRAGGTGACGKESKDGSDRVVPSGLFHGLQERLQK